MNINVKSKVVGFVTRIEVRDKEGNLVHLMDKPKKNSILGQATFLNSSSSKTSGAYWRVAYAIKNMATTSGSNLGLAWGASDTPNEQSMIGLQDMKQGYSRNWVGDSGKETTKAVYRGDGDWYDSVAGTVAFTAYSGEATVLAEVSMKTRDSATYKNGDVITRCVLDTPIEIKNGYFVTITYEFRFYYPTIAKNPIEFTATQNGVTKSGYLTMPAINLPNRSGDTICGDFIDINVSDSNSKYIPFSRVGYGSTVIGPLLGGLGTTDVRATLGFTDLPNGLTRNSDGNIEYPLNSSTTVKMDVEQEGVSGGNWIANYAASPLGLVPNGTCSISLFPAFNGASTLTIYWIYFAGLLFYFPDPITKTGEDALDISLTWSLSHD